MEAKEINHFVLKYAYLRSDVKEKPRARNEDILKVLSVLIIKTKTVLYLYIKVSLITVAMETGYTANVMH